MDNSWIGPDILTLFFLLKKGCDKTVSCHIYPCVKVKTVENNKVSSSSDRKDRVPHFGYIFSLKPQKPLS